MKILLRESQINGLIEDLEKVNDSDNYYSPDLNILSVNEFVYPESHYYAGVKAVKYIVGDEKPIGEFRIGCMPFVAPGFDLYDETPRNWHRCISMLGEVLKDFVNNHYKPQTIVFSPEGEMQRKRYQSHELINFIIGYIGDMYSSQVDGRNTLYSLKRMNEQMAAVSTPTIVGGETIKPTKPTTKDALLDADDAVDVASAYFDTIPELGNLISLGIDVIHAGVYAYRYFNADTDQEKIEYGIMGLITLITAAYPFVGNHANIAARGGIKGFVRRTPEEILQIAQKLGLYNKKIWPLQKSKWSFSIGLFIYKATRGQVEDLVAPLLNKLKEITNKVKGTPLEKSFNEFRDLVDGIGKNKDIYRKMVESRLV